MEGSFDCTFGKPSAVLQQIRSTLHYTCCYSCKRDCTFGGMATEVNAQKHLKMLLSYLGAQWLFKARPSFQYTLKPKYFETHRFLSLNCIKRGLHLGQREHYFHLTAGCLLQCLISPWPYYWTGCPLILIQTKLSGLILPCHHRGMGQNCLLYFLPACVCVCICMLNLEGPSRLY